MPQVSVVIPTYNDNWYIAKAIDSVLNQTYTDYEILVIDDGSTDSTCQILEHYGDRINYIYQKHQGVSIARNLGIEKARGDLISFLDADDYFLPDHLEQQVSCLAKQPSLGMVSSGWCRVDQHDNVLSENEPWRVLPKLNLETWLISRPVLPSAMTIRKEWLEKVNGFSSKFVLAQDIDLILRLAFQGCQADWSRKITSCYRSSASNATNNAVKQARFFDTVFNDFFAQDNLPRSIARLENQARYSYLKWLGWRLYHTENFSLMTSYLSRSLAYSDSSKTETICDWIKYFAHCSLDEGCELDAYSLSNLPEWKRLMRFELKPKVLSPTKSQLALPTVKKYQKPKVSGFPPDLVLPPFVGENNDYTFIEEQVKNLADTNQIPQLSVSIIIFGDRSSVMLAKTLAAIANQTYPQHLIETIIIEQNDNTEIKSVIQKYQQNLDLTYLQLPEREISPGAICNFGIKKAKHDYLIVLDGDMLPSPGLVAAYMKYFQVTDKVALIGDRRFVDTREVSEDLVLNNIEAVLKLPDASTQKDVWQREGDLKILDSQHKIYANSHYLKKDRYPFRAFVSCNVAFSKKLSEKAGFFDETISHYGFRDQEFGYRIYNEGYYFVPVMDALALHQDPLDGRNKQDKRTNHQAEAKLFEQKCPVGWYRNHQPGKTYDVPKVSIYIPSYNNGKYIKEAIDSVLNQTYTDVEVCICDDGSTDNTLQVLEENFQDHPQVRWVAQTNGGIGKASNGAVNLCRGMYIGQLDSDDLLKPEAVATLVECLEKNSFGCVYTSCQRIDAEGNYLQDEYSYPTFSREKMLITSIVHHFRMFRRRDWLRTEGFNEQLVNAVDYDMFLKLSEVCAFHHINEMLYLRRWHGNNTSFVNEKKQSSNTHTVITYSLARMGLADSWEVYAPNPEKPREVSLRRKQELTNLFFFPDYRKSNIYQNLLYAHTPDNHALYSGDIDDAIQALKDGLKKVIFHLHWTNYILRRAENLAEAEKLKNQFLKKLFEFLSEGGRLIWTIHNTLPHDCSYPKQEIELRNTICIAASKIHIHSAKSIAEIQEYLYLPLEKVQIVHHGNYVGLHSNDVSQIEARRSFSFSSEETVFLFLGQIRPYKGIEDLFQAFAAIQAEFPNTRLLIAGMPVEAIDKENFISNPEALSKVTFIEKYIPEEELQWYFNAADIVVLPYRKILTSGSLLHGMSFSRPVIAPQVGMTAEIIQDNYNGFLYEIGDVQSLANAMSKMAALEQKQKEKLFQNAFQSIEHLTWHNVAPEILAGV
jgi:O-antigen biosynthesis protein